MGQQDDQGDDERAEHAEQVDEPHRGLLLVEGEADQTGQLVVPDRRATFARWSSCSRMRRATSFVRELL